MTALVWAGDPDVVKHGQSHFPGGRAVYEKKLMSRRPMRFRYAPPLTGLDDYSADELPKVPFKGAKPYQRSVYYYWWLFLKEHDGYRACCEAAGEGDFAKLYADFGDIRGDDFMAWWKRTGRSLFCEPDSEPILVDTGGGLGPSDDTRLVVSLPLNRDFDELLADLRQMLMPLRKQVPLTPSTGQARYPVSAKPVLSSLHQHHQLWTLRKQHPDVPLHELADMAGIEPSGEDERGVDVKQVKASTASRYLKQARCIIDYVGKGYFPITKPTPKSFLG